MGESYFFISKLHSYVDCVTVQVIQYCIQLGYKQRLHSTVHIDFNSIVISLIFAVTLLEILSQQYNYPKCQEIFFSW